MWLSLSRLWRRRFVFFAAEGRERKRIMFFRERGGWGGRSPPICERPRFVLLEERPSLSLL